MVRAVLSGLVAGLIAAVVAWLINYFKHPRSFTPRKVLAAILLLIVAGAIAGAAFSAQQESPLEAEERILGQLEPDMSLERVSSLLAQPPDRVTPTRSGSMAQFRRTWEYIHVFVDDNEQTEAIAVILRDGAKLRPGQLGRWPYPFGKSMYDYEREYFQSVAYGHLDRGFLNCAAYGKAIGECDPSTAAGFDFGDCLNTTGWGTASGRKVRQETECWAIVVTAADRDITPDMLRSPD